MKKSGLIPFKDKQRVSIFVEQEQIKELKKKAIDSEMSLSEYLVTAGLKLSVIVIKDES